MAISNIWTATYGGVTQPCSQWGMSNGQRRRQSAKIGELTFDMPGLEMDAALPFTYLQPFSLFRSGACWFQGVVTKTPRRGTPDKEDIGFTISDPLFWLANTVFQQQFVTANLLGAPGALMTTTRSRVIPGQGGIMIGANPPIIKMNLGQVMLEVLYYAIYAYQGVDYPTTVGSSGLPAAPSTAGAPFLIGAVSPSMTIPYFEIKDKNCLDIIKILMRFVPDCILWMDYTTTPATLNISQRPLLPARTISVFSGAPVRSFNASPMYELQVPAVVAKYEEVNTEDGLSLDNLIVDQWPTTVNPTKPLNLVQTIDLVGGNTAFEKSNVTVQPRPVTGLETTAMDWLKAHHPDLVSGLDMANMQIVGLTTAVLPGSKELAAPYNMPADGTGYDNELLGGTVTPWMWDNGSYLAAEANLQFSLIYVGNDLATMMAFSALQGFMLVSVKTKITNAQTQLYRQMVSETTPETAPIGNAEILWTILNKLYHQGTLEAVEQDCSDPLPLGCTFNTLDGLEEWQSFDALVIRVTELLDKGTTTVEFGPPLYLSLQTMAEIYRANQTLYTWKLNQRLNGQTGSPNTTIGPDHAAHSGATLPPPRISPSSIMVLMRVNPASHGPSFTYQVMVVLPGLGTTFTDPTSGQTCTVAGVNTWLTLNATDTIWLLGDVYLTALQSMAIHSFGDGDSDYSATATPWTTGGIVENDGATPPNQVLFRKPIATFVPDTLGRPQFATCISTNLKIVNLAMGSPALPGIYPEPL